MFSLLNLTKKKKRMFDGKVLRKNDISILILDERWNALFKNVEKSDKIKLYEKKLRDLLKEEARLGNEAKEITIQKKKHLDRIIKLTPEVYEKNDPAAKNEMQNCEKEVNRINERIKRIESELEKIPDQIRETNLELLEHTVNSVYFRLREDRRKVKELEKLIEITKKKLEEYIEEKAKLSEDDTESYSYFHDLIGGEELEKLDREYFGITEVRHDNGNTRSNEGN